MARLLSRLAASLALTSAVQLAVAQSDGNPHGWDRQRRCDHSGYAPRCGACEGVGGIVWSDTAADIKIAPCKVVSTADQLDAASLVRPVWGAEFSVSKSHEILIGKKTDPFCFQAFPSNDSTSTNCYKPQEVKLYSDMATTKALRLDANQAGNAWGVLGNVTSKIFHQGSNMWIINHLPLGVTQTVCVAPHEGGDSKKAAVFPVQYNWVDNLFFVARETLEVEYGVGEQTLDHWAFGPHHAWVNPQTGIIVRMWQPFNGLQIFEPGSFSRGADPKLFGELSPDGSKPPKEAMPGGSTFRIKCSETGFPVAAKAAAAVAVRGAEAARGAEVASSSSSSGRGSGSSSSTTEAASLVGMAKAPAGEAKACKADLQRARTRVPRPDYRGDDFGAMAKTLNSWLLRHAPRSRDCEAWSLAELQQLQLLLLTLRDPALDSIYQAGSDNRRLRRGVEEVQREWAELNKLAETDPELAKMHRDGHCHEAVMWYVHHLPEVVKAELKEKIVLPLLSHARHDSARVAVQAPRLGEAYEEKVSCASCHSNVSPEMALVV